MTCGFLALAVTTWAENRTARAGEHSPETSSSI
jgi:hypothetical protein